MKRGRAVAFLSAWIISGTSLININAGAAENVQQTFASKYSADPTQTFFTGSNMNGSQAGIFFASNVRGVVLPTVEVRKGINNGQSFQAHLCTGIDDSSCSPSQGWNGAKVVSGIGNCYNDAAAIASCVESFSIIGADGKEYVAKPSAKFPSKAPEFPGIPGNYPPGHAPWLWKVEGDPSGSDNEYLLAGYINSAADTKKGSARGGVIDGKWSPIIQNFNFEIIPVYKESAPNIKANLAQEIVQGELHRVASLPVIGCYAADDGLCINRRPFTEGTKVKITLHLSRRISGWIEGRLDRPVVTTSHINDNVDRVNVTAGFSHDVFAGKFVDKNSQTIAALQAPSACPKNNKFGAVISGQQAAMGMDPGEDCAIDYYKQLAPVLGDSAFAITPSWTLTTTQKTSNISKCITDVDGLAGVGATNAAAYDPGEPQYNSSDSTLTYRVAAPSKTKDGSSIAGRYALAISTPVFQCLYNIKTIPSEAKISITSTGGKDVVQTVSINQSGGWVNFAANNFDFSDTSLLTISFPKAAPAPSSPVAAAAPAATKAATAKPAIVTITCIKGKVKKIVSGAKPTCPAGYKKA